MSDEKENQCFYIAPLSDEEVDAIKAVGNGEATPFQQRLTLHAIVNKFSRSHDILFVPEDRDATSFLSGRGFVGANILRILKIPVGRLTTKGE